MCCSLSVFSGVGVPQGLGLLLFVIFIYDLIEFCGYNANIFLFADDAKLYNHIKRCGDELKLQGEIDNLVTWADEWLVKINSSKCKAMSVWYQRRSEEYTLEKKLHKIVAFSVSVFVSFSC